MQWSLEPATHGAGSWFVGRGDERIELVAAPGAHVPAGEVSSDPGPAAGWRHGVWSRTWNFAPNLDRDPPDTPLCQLTTRQVLAVVEDRLHSAVMDLLIEQLEYLESLDVVPAVRQHPRYEQMAHAALLGTAWIRSELAAGFPEQYAHLWDPGELLQASQPSGLHAAAESQITTAEDLPDTLAEVEAQFPTTVYAERLGGHELLRLLKRRFVWRGLEAAPRLLVLAVFACTWWHDELQELTARLLSESAFEAGWPSVHNLGYVEGHAKRVRAVCFPNSCSAASSASADDRELGVHPLLPR